MVKVVIVCPGALCITTGTRRPNEDPQCTEGQSDQRRFGQVILELARDGYSISRHSVHDPLRGQVIIM